MARSLSFFYRRNQLSAEIRGRQIATALGAKINPTDGYADDVCILVKCLPGLLHRERGLTDFHDWYYDAVDNQTALRWLLRHPDVKVLVASLSAQTYLGARVKNPITCIPQHHCNVERFRRRPRPVKVVGYVGVDHAITGYRDAVTKAVEGMGLEMRWVTDFKTREDVVEAYGGIDIQLVWRDGMPETLLWMKNPMKIVNAASFGIPTVAKPEPAFDAECPNWYLAAHSVDDALAQIHRLKDDADLYAWYADPGPDRAEPYHLDHIAAQYRRLADA
jgi:hypothetical protein